MRTQAVSELQEGHGPYKASIALSSPSSDTRWGSKPPIASKARRSPGVDVLPSALFGRQPKQYEADLANRRRSMASGPRDLP